MKNYKEILSQIKTFIFDVDGVLTDGSLTITSNGEMLRTMNVKDGFAMKAALDAGYKIAIISGGTNEGVRDRLEALGIEFIYLGAHNKIKQLNSFIKSSNVDLKNILYMGDDIPDIPVLKIVGLSCCPQDAVNEVKDNCNYISSKNGGKGAVRDVIEQVMKIHDKWNRFNNAQIDWFNMLKKKLSNYDIILASQSPRRINFFNELNIKFKSLKLDFDESYPNNLIAEQITDFIVNKKASYYSDLLNKNTVVITSDTIVWLNGKAIGKPKNNENAKEILQTLSGKTHKVITSFCIKTLESKKIVNDITEVTFKQLTEKEIDFYINHNKVLDKAGAYGIQDWIGYIGITNINGTYNNVMGLPTHLLYKELMNL